jgi:glycosyltransferase involved in cell wall biosynthesis
MNHRLKVAIASSGLGHVARGIEAWAADLGSALAERGQNVTLCKGGGRTDGAFEHVIPCWQREAAPTARLLRWLPRRLTWRVGMGSAYGIEQTTFALNLCGFLRQQRVDILHVQDPQVARIVQWVRRLGWVRCRTILAHGTEETLQFQSKITYLQHLAPWHLEEARRAGIWKPTWTAIPNFIDTDRFRHGRSTALRAELGISSESLVVLTVAAIKRKHKRIDYLLEEMARLVQRHPHLPICLVVAGGWEKETDELVDLGHRLLGSQVRFLVRFPRERMPELYRLADAFVLCSLKEMMPIALLEATASGLPCLVNRHPVVQWMIGAGGEAIDMADPGELAAAMDKLLTDPAGRARLGQRARQHCLEHFGRDRVVDQILHYYQFVLSHDCPGRGRSRKTSFEGVATP